MAVTAATDMAVATSVWWRRSLCRLRVISTDNGGVRSGVKASISSRMARCSSDMPIGFLSKKWGKGAPGAGQAGLDRPDGYLQLSGNVLDAQA